MKYIHRIHPSRISTISITYGAGSRVEHKNKYPYGIAHYMEHMRFKGTDRFSAKEMARALAVVGGDWNAFTSKDMVNYHVELPEENIERGFELLSEIVLRPIFPEDEAKKEMEVVCQEIRSYDDDMTSMVYKNLYGKVFNNSLANEIVGTEGSVRSITRDHLLNFSKEFYFPAGALVVVASNMPYTHLVEKYFGIPDDVFILHPESKNVEYAAPFDMSFIKDGFKQHTIMIAFGNEQIRQVVKQNRAAATVFNHIFGGGGADARLFSRVREDLGLVYGIGSSFQNNFDGALFTIGTSTEPENSEKVIQTINEVILELFSKLPSEEELLKAKNMIKSQYYRSLDTSTDATMNALKEEIYGYTGGSKFLAEIENVSLEQVMDVAKKVFDANKYVVIGKGE